MVFQITLPTTMMPTDGLDVKEVNPVSRVTMHSSCEALSGVAGSVGATQ